MKKLIVLLLSGLMIFGLSACGGEEEAATPPPAPVVEEPVVEEPAPVEEPEPVISGETYSGNALNITYSEPWIFDENYTSEYEDYTSISLDIMDGENYLASAYIEISEDYAEYHRELFSIHDMDAYDIVVNGNIGETINVGGVECHVAYGVSWGDPVTYIFGRDIAKSANIDIEISGEYEQADLEALLAGIEITLPDLGATDPPWFWEGEPFVAGEPISLAAGDYTLTAELIAFDEPLQVFDVFSGRIAKGVGDDLWVAADAKMYQYTLGETLATVGRLELPIDADEICADGNGTIYINDFMEPLHFINTEGMVFSTYDTVDANFVVHPSGIWGLDYFFGSEINLLTFTDGNYASTDFLAETEDFTFDSVAISEDRVYVNGVNADSDSFIRVYDLDANLIHELGGLEFGVDPDVIGSITQIASTDNGIIALDGNLRSLLIWNHAGEFIANVEVEDLFNVEYPWVSSIINAGDGSLLVALIEERPDSSGDELLIYRLTGF